MDTIQAHQNIAEESLKKRYYALIKVYETPFRSAREIKALRLFWGDMNLDQFMKWKWYFEYRAALLKVEHPRKAVELDTGFLKVDLTKKDHSVLRKKRITTVKRMITKISNALAAYEEEQSKLLLPDLQAEQYLLGKEKLERYIEELTELIREDC